MKTPWRPKVEPLIDGEQVKAEVANRPIEQLVDQTKNLNERLQDLSAKSGRMVFTNAPLGSEVSTLDFVYYDVEDHVFKPAIADIRQTENGEFRLAPSAMVVGMVMSKSTSILGDILQFGRINLTDEGIDPDTLVEDPEGAPFAPGRYFLSAKVPGKITSVSPSPSIQVGFFTTEESHVYPVHKDIFDSHQHHRYPMVAKPAASQNFDQSGWSALGASGDGAIKYVDYYNAGDSSHTQIIMCVKSNGDTPIDSANSIRIDLFNSSGQLYVQLAEDNLDRYDPASGDTLTQKLLVDWPAYGEWVDVPDTNLSVAFIRADADYSNTLAVDAAALLTTTDKQFKVWLPDDLSGWTNANQLDILLTPPGVLYRYLLETDQELLAAFPPLPVSSAIVELNGQNLHPDDDFKVTALGIYWVNGGVIGDYSPWPSDYSAADGAVLLQANARNIGFHFIKSSLSNSDFVVFSLKGIAPLKVTRCPDGKPGSSGHLQISLDLSLLKRDQDPVTSDVAVIDFINNTFVMGDMVSSLEEGYGVRIEQLTTETGRNVGKLRVSVRALKFEGEVQTIALRNAKEVGSNPVLSYIDFLPPSTAPTGITASFKIPNADIDTGTLKLKMSTLVRGDTAVISGGAEQTAIFKVVWHVLRPDFSVADMNDSTAVVIQYWKAVFPSSYEAGKFLANEMPYDSGDLDAFQIDADTLVANPSSLVALSGGFLPGDVLSVQIDRVAQDGSGNIDNYAGRVGITGLRWILP